MSGANGTVTTSKGMSTLVRPRFGPGMLLQHDDLDQLTTYTRELNRLMFSSLFGCGVVCGLVVEPATDCGKASITVGAGLALDCTGDPIYVPRDQSVVIDEHCDPDLEGPLWVLLCGTSKCCSPRTSMCPSDDDETPPVCTRERDGFEIRIVRNAPKCSCNCIPLESAHDQGSDTPRATDSGCACVEPSDPCYYDHYQGKCGCHCDDECTGGGCDCVLLARLNKSTGEQVVWTADHSVRRFIRPVLMRDPVVESERQKKSEAAKKKKKTEPKTPKP